MQNNILKPLSDDTKANPKAASVRIKSLSLTRAKSQRRHDLRIGKQPLYVDKHRVHLNRILEPLRSLPDIRNECEHLRSQRDCARKMKANAAVVVSGIITFGHEAQMMFEALSTACQDEAFRDLAQRIADRLETQLEGLVSHGDETAPHAHFMLRGYTHEGLPVSTTATYKVTAELQDIAAEVMQTYCSDIERGHKKWDRIKNGADYADTLHRSVKQLHEDLPREIEAHQAALASLADQIVDQEASLEKTRGHLRKAEARRHKTAQQFKRIKTYQRRLAKKNTFLQHLEREATLRQAELAAMADTLTAQSAEAGRRETDLKDAEEALDHKLLELELDAYFADLKIERAKEIAAEADQRAEAAKLARRADEAAAEAARAEAKQASADKMSSEAAIEQHCIEMTDRHDSLVAQENGLRAGVAAVKSVVQELSTGTLRRDENGKWVMQSSSALREAPSWLLAELRPLIHKMVDLRSSLERGAERFASKLSELSSFLLCEDLTDEAREAGASLQRGAAEVDIGGPS